MDHQKPITNIARHTKRLYWHLLKKGRYEHSLKALELRMKLKKLNIRLDSPIDLSQHLYQLDAHDIPLEYNDPHKMEQLSEERIIPK